MLLIYFLVVFLLAVIAYQLFKLNKSKKLDSEIKEKERIEEKISKIFPYLYKKECEREFFIDREFFNCSYFEDIAKLLKLPLASFRDCDVSYSDKFSLMHKKRDSENDPVKKEKIQKTLQIDLKTLHLFQENATKKKRKDEIKKKEKRRKEEKRRR